MITALLDLLAEVVLGRCLELLQDHRRDLRRRVASCRRSRSARVSFSPLTTLYGTVLISSRDFVEPAAHEPLDRVDGVLRVGDRLPLGDLADETLAVLGERHDRGVVRLPSWFGDDDGLAALHHGDHGVGRAEVDSDDMRHA